MARLSTKNFIKTVFIEQLKGIIDYPLPYHAFMIMSIGIEFLGKCLKTDQSIWHTKARGESPDSFKKAIREIPSLKKYEPYLEKYDLYDGLRCGLLHSAQPGVRITLSSEANSKNETGHLVEDKQFGIERINFKCEEFYADFKEACEWVIEQEYEADDKMNGDFLDVPDWLPSNLYSGENSSPTSSASIPPEVK